MIGNGSLDFVLTFSKVSQHFETLTVGVKLLPGPPVVSGEFVGHVKPRGGILFDTQVSDNS